MTRWKIQANRKLFWQNFNYFHFQKGVFEQAKEKVGDMAESVKETAQNAYDKVTGNRTEDKAADKVKDAADCCAEKASDARDYMADKSRDAARKLEGH